MPSANANIRAKLSAHMETGATLLAKTRAPAATSSPAIVSMSGRPAATKLPKAMAKMARVTGQLMSSERIMAERLAELKSAHRALSPVKVTDMARELIACNGP